MPRLISSSILYLAFLTCSANAGVITFVDSTFNDTDWVSERFGQDSSQITTEQVQTGGNLGAWRRTIAPAPANDTTSPRGELHLLRQARFDPATQGDLLGIDFSHDIMQSQGPTHNFIVYFLIRQNDTYYSLNGWAVQNNSEWYEISSSLLSPNSLTSTNFRRIRGSAGLNPDFTRNGSELEFGYMTFAVNRLAGTPEVVGGIDNWSVTLNYRAVPEPTSPLILMCCVAAVVNRRSRPRPNDIDGERTCGATRTLRAERLG